jgi:hypothetical protein
MQGSSGTWKQKPRHKWRRRIAWTVGIVLLVFGGLIALGAAVGTKSGAGHRSGAASNKPTAPVSRIRTIPVGIYGGIGGHSRMKVVSVDWHARADQLGAGPTIPRGAQDVIVKLRVKYLGGGSASTQDVSNGAKVVGSHGAVYDNNAACSGTDLGGGGIQVFSHQSVEGNVCFQIAKNDARTLRLFEYSVGTDTLYPGKNAKRTWFALHR